MIVTRNETAADREAIFTVHAAAFPTAAEARLVDRLRRETDPYIGLVAVDAETVVGHIAFSPISWVVDRGVSGSSGVSGASSPQPASLGLAPMAVLPAYQRHGIGSRLVVAGLEAAAVRGHHTVVVLGHPEYYPRFGFVRADHRGWSFAPGTEHAFFVRGPVPDGPGIVRYHDAFSSV